MNTKRHHLIPRTYMQSWSHNSNSVYIMRLDGDKAITERSIFSIAKINHQYSITAGMSICTREDTDVLFKPLSDYKVFYRGKEISDTLKMNELYNDYDSWEIQKPDGRAAKKAHLKEVIERQKINEIEINWDAQYENKWTIVRDLILQKNQEAYSRKSETIPSFKKGYLSKFFCMMDWRSNLTNQVFNDCLDFLSPKELKTISIPSKLNRIKTPYDSIKHEMLLGIYREFLNKKGAMYEVAKTIIREMTFCFLVDDLNGFITSDNPAFIAKTELGSNIGILPITPSILMLIVKKTGNNDCYYTRKATRNEVEKYNQVIMDNADEFIIKMKS